MKKQAEASKSSVETIVLTREPRPPREVFQDPPLPPSRTSPSPASPEWIHGFAVALAEVHRHQGCSTVIREVAVHAGITIARARAAGVDGFDLDELSRAGIAGA